MDDPLPPRLTPMYEQHMSEPILGILMLQLTDERAQLEGEPIGPLSFEDVVALLITDHEAHPH